MIERETSIERRLRAELRLKLGWRDINTFGGVYCWSGPYEVAVHTEYNRRSVGINVYERFTFPANTPVDEVVDSVLVQLTFLK